MLQIDDSVQEIGIFVASALDVLQSCTKLLRLNKKKVDWTWWRHQMETFSALLAICAGNSPVTSEFPAQRPVMGIFDVFFDLHLKKQLNKQSRGWWFEMVSRSLWRHCN